MSKVRKVEVNTEEYLERLSKELSGKQIKRVVYGCLKCNCIFFSALDLEYHLKDHIMRESRLDIIRNEQKE